MLKDKNDSDEDAYELVRLIRKYDLPAKVNLIPFNPWPGSDYETSTPDRVNRFSAIVFRRRHIRSRPPPARPGHHGGVRPNSSRRARRSAAPNSTAAPPRRKPAGRRWPRNPGGAFANTGHVSPQDALQPHHPRRRPPRYRPQRRRVSLRHALRPRAAGDLPLHDRGAGAGHRPQPRAGRGRGLYGRHDGRRARRHQRRRQPRHLQCPLGQAPTRCGSHCGGRRRWPAGSASSTRRRSRSATSRTTTTSATGSTTCSSMPTGNTAARISPTPATRWSRPSRTSWRTSPPSST